MFSHCQLLGVLLDDFRLDFKVSLFFRARIKFAIVSAALDLCWKRDPLRSVRGAGVSLTLRSGGWAHTHERERTPFEVGHPLRIETYQIRLQSQEECQTKRKKDETIKAIVMWHASTKNAVQSMPYE